MNNEHTGITFKVLTTINKHGTMMWRREALHDNYGRDAHSQRRGTHSPVHAVLHQRTVQKRRAEGSQDRWPLEDQTRRPKSFCRQASTGTRQKIKPASCWQWTINKFRAVRLFLMDCDPGRNSLWCTLPICSIATALKGCQEYAMNIHWLCRRWVRNRKVYP